MSTDAEICRRCGACCQLGGVRLQPEDGGIPVELTEPDVDHATVRMRTRLQNSRCVALDGSVGVWCGCQLCTAGDDRRPIVCRLFPRGGIDCAAARGLAGLPPLAAADAEPADSFIRRAERALHAGVRVDQGTRAAWLRRVFGGAR